MKKVKRDVRDKFPRRFNRVAWFRWLKATKTYGIGFPTLRAAKAFEADIPDGVTEPIELLAQMAKIEETRQ